jgi:antitoxin component of MazEF toxin-antitoxin module
MTYKNYSLEQLKNFLYDAMGAAEASPQEIYDVIKGVVEDNYYTYKHQTSQAYELLALLNGNGKGHITMYDDTELMPHLQCDKDDTSEECKNSWSDFWEEPSMPPWGHSDMEALRYTEEEMNAMCDAAKAKDKVKKWVLPIDNDGVVLFPDDLLEAANLKEGDLLDWVDNGDGSYLLKKFERKTNTYDDMIADVYR